MENWIKKLRNKTYNFNGNVLNAVEAYAYIINHLNESDKESWQNIYKNFFMVKRRKSEWIKLYFQFFNELKNKGKIALSDLEANLKNFYDLQKDLPKQNVETSFISKAMHVLNNDLPIWDKNIRQTLHHCKSNPIQGSTSDERIKKSVDWYHRTNDAVQKEIKDQQNLIEEFRANFSNHNEISDVKIIDFYYWIIANKK